MVELSPFSYTTCIEVRYRETDQMGIVHHSVYPIWFEYARTDFFKAKGYSYVEIEKQGFTCPVLKLKIQYKYPTHYGEIVKIKTTFSKMGAYHFKFDYKLYVGKKLCSIASSLHCFLKNGKPTKDFPKEVSLFLHSQ